MKMKENALLKNFFKAGTVTNIAMGVGLIIIGPVVVSLAAKILRPISRSAIKRGKIIYQEVRKIALEAQESKQGATPESLTTTSKGQFDSSQIPSFEGRDGSLTEVTPVGSSTPASKPHQSERAGPWIVRGY